MLDMPVPMDMLAFLTLLPMDMLDSPMELPFMLDSLDWSAIPMVPWYLLNPLMLLLPVLNIWLLWPLLRLREPSSLLERNLL